MPFARGDMRDHLVSHKNDHGASYGRYAGLVLQPWSRLKIAFARFSSSFKFRLLQHYPSRTDIVSRAYPTPKSIKTGSGMVSVRLGRLILGLYQATV